MMKKINKKKALSIGIIFVLIFAIWTALIQIVDVKPIGQKGTNIGFSTFNSYFHNLTGANMTIYNITDWLGLVPILICLGFGIFGFVQLIKRKSLFRVDSDIIILGVYYVVVIGAYALFEIIPINYRPILIEGVLEASYPSSTTLLVLCVVPTFIEQIGRRMKDGICKKILILVAVLFSCFMVIGRLISGVHWFTDILGGVFLSVGLFYMYKGFVLLFNKDNEK